MPGKNQHTSKSKLNLRDRIGFKHMKDSSDKKKCKPQKSGLFSDIFGERPRSFRSLGPRKYEALSQYKASAALYMVTSFLTICYFCEWKAVLQYMPFYNGKYKED
ncbi:uncharacterized protein LOC143191792 [Rhynchophorus ferrugineus]|uniref:Uncharacterized protein n=1 Tax=Rhynchophorus ferrugineus TaxID=354439 RepID=A0A834IQF6_RHYFE|nr:hypothetical protein GWI33_008758 [Rhynchophorus ferrugineus]